MLFATGTPQKVNTFEEKLVQMTKPHRGIFFTISQSSLMLWTLKPLVLVTKLTRTEKSVQEEGANSHLFWKPDHTTVAVLTTKGKLSIFTIMIQQSIERLMEYNFKTQIYYMSGPGESKGIPPYSLVLHFSRMLKEPIACAFSLLDKICLITQTGSLEIILWDGNFLSRTPVNNLGLISKFSNSVFLSNCTLSHYNLFGWVYSDGTASFVINKDSNGSFKEHLCPGIGGENERKATCSALNLKFHLLAVGLDNGDVNIYSIRDPQDALILVETLSLKKIGEYQHPSLQIGPVTSLDWSSDGYALAVSWKQKGFSVWGSSGHLLACSIMQHLEIEIAETNGIQENENHNLFDNGVNYVTWGPESYELFIASPKDNNDNYLDIFLQSFVKSSVTMCHTQDNAKFATLIGRSSFQVYIGGTTGIDVTTPDVQYWKHIQFPQNYISDNWPISVTSISGDGKFLAIAGKRGVAHFNLVTNKWKLFNNIQHEREFRCRGGIVWYKDVMVVACQDINTLNYEIRFYWQNSKLDRQFVLFVQTIPRLILHLSIYEDILLVYTADNIVREFKIEMVLDTADEANLQPNHFFNMQLSNETSLHNHVSHVYDVQSIHWLPIEWIPEITSYPFLILESGELSLYHRVKQSITKIEIAKRVQQFWMSPKDSKTELLQNALCIYDNLGLSVKVNKPQQVENDINFEDFLKNSIRIPSQFYPLSILIEEGVLMGVDFECQKKRFLNRSTNFFKILTQNHLFLPNILRYLLKKRESEKALKFANCYKDLNYFTHSLEILLHEILEEDKKEMKSEQTILNQVIIFIEQFPHFLDVVMGVARKTETDSWNYFFSYAGSPTELFEMCLQTGRLRTACSYLSILQNIEERSVSKAAANRLLEASLHTEEFEIAEEIIGFFQKITAAKSDEEGSQENLQLQLANHAKLLLGTGRVRALGDFSRHLQFPLKSWLREINSKASVVNLESTFQFLHQQFHWPYPEESSEPQPNQQHGSLLQRIQAQKLQRKQEIEYLLEIMVEVKCIDWCILLASLLCQKDQLIEIFKKDSTRLKDFTKMLETTQCSVYINMGKEVSNQIK